MNPKWTEGLRAKLKKMVQVTHVVPGKAAIALPALFTFVPVPGRPDVEAVTASATLLSSGTLEFKLPTTCHDPKVMGFNDPGAIGNTLVQQTKKSLQRPEPLACRPFAYRTVGPCPHVAFSSPVGIDNTSGTHVWRVLWSEPVDTFKIGQALTKTNPLTAGKSTVVSKAVVDTLNHEVTLKSEKDETYVLRWGFDANAGIAADFVSTFSCLPAVGSAVIGQSVLGKTGTDTVSQVLPGLVDTSSSTEVDAGSSQDTTK